MNLQYPKTMQKMVPVAASFRNPTSLTCLVAIKVFPVRKQWIQHRWYLDLYFSNSASLLVRAVWSSMCLHNQHLFRKKNLWMHVNAQPGSSEQFSVRSFTSQGASQAEAHWTRPPTFNLWSMNDSMTQFNLLGILRHNSKTKRQSLSCIPSSTLMPLRSCPARTASSPVPSS